MVDTTNLGLMSDCVTLLEARDILSGTASLNWAADTHMSEWDGVTVGGTPLHVTQLSLHDRGLTGEIPTELENLSNLHSAVTVLRNQLTRGDTGGTGRPLQPGDAVTSGRNQLSRGYTDGNWATSPTWNELSLLGEPVDRGYTDGAGRASPTWKTLDLGGNQLTGDIPAGTGQPLQPAKAVTSGGTS